MKQGIDVSKWQPKVDWKKVKADGIDFAIIRIGYCYNNGALKLDSAFTQHIKGALAAGLDVGIYLYSYATTVQAAKRAAQRLSKRSSRTSDLPHRLLTSNESILSRPTPTLQSIFG